METLPIGSYYTIPWTDVDGFDRNLNPLNVGIDISRDSQATWEEIAVTLADGRYTWRVTGPEAIGGQFFRVRDLISPETYFAIGAEFAIGAAIAAGPSGNNNCSINLGIFI